MEHYLYENGPQGIAPEELNAAIEASLEGRTLRKVLLIPPDFTRLNSGCGPITNRYYHLLTSRGCAVDVLPALGTHQPLTREEAEVMFGDIPWERFLVHDWRHDVVRLGEVPGAFLAEKSGGIWTEPIDVEVNRRVMDPGYDLIISLGQVVPHVVVGMANHAKNLFVGVGGSDMINKSHMLGALYGPERILGRDHTPVRELFDYAYEHFLADRPILFVLTVCTVPDGVHRMHGVFFSESRAGLEAAIALAQRHNMTFLPRGLKKCVAYLDPEEFKSTWLGNKALFRTCMAMEPGGELIILAKGLRMFGEDTTIDTLLRKYGYHERKKLMEAFEKPENCDLRENMGAAAHMLQSAVEGRFRVIYAVEPDMIEPVRAVGYEAVTYEQAAQRYDPAVLRPGFQTMPDGEEIYYIPNPAIGLWVDTGRFEMERKS